VGVSEAKIQNTGQTNLCGQKLNTFSLISSPKKRFLYIIPGSATILMSTYKKPYSPFPKRCSNCQFSGQSRSHHKAKQSLYVWCGKWEEDVPFTDICEDYKKRDHLTPSKEAFL
jgi:hypothetical protein